jgi:pimeloyl-ACP methyl ester carboxylesterase
MISRYDLKMKTDVYLLIGLTKESRHWSEEFIHALKEKLNPNSIQFVDLPGSGRFLNSSSPLKMEDIVTESRTQLKFYPGHRRVVISMSLGGMSAWSWSVLYPDDFTHMVMINSSLGGLSPFWKRVQPAAMIQFFKIAGTKRGSKKEQRILGLCSNHEEKSRKIHPSWTLIGEEANMSLLNSIRQIIAGIRFRPKAAPQIPLLVVASKHDRLAHFSCSQAIAQYAKAELILTDEPSIGHAFHVDGPDLLAETIGKWLSNCPA